MASGSLQKPMHLGPGEPSWLRRRPAGALALGLGMLWFLVVVSVHGIGTAGLPPYALTLPGLGLVGAAAVASLARREPGAYPLWLIGLALAAASVVLGYFLLIAVVVGAAAVLMVILHAVM